MSDRPLSPGRMGLSVPKRGHFQANGDELVTPGLMGAEENLAVTSSVNPPQPSYTSFKKLPFSTGI